VDNSKLDACAARVDALSSRFDRFAKRRVDAVGDDLKLRQARAENSREKYRLLAQVPKKGEAYDETAWKEWEKKCKALDKAFEAKWSKPFHADNPPGGAALYK